MTPGAPNLAHRRASCSRPACCADQRPRGDAQAVDGIRTSPPAASQAGPPSRTEFGISQPAVSQHLRVLREAGFATVRPDGARRLYAVEPDPLREVDAWLDRFRAFWTPHLDALETEIARGRRQRRLRDTPDERSSS